MFDQLLDLQKLQTDLVTNTTEEIYKMREDDKTASASVKDLVTSVESLNEKGLKASEKQVEILDELKTLRRNISTTSTGLDDTR